MKSARHLHSKQKTVSNTLVFLQAMQIFTQSLHKAKQDFFDKMLKKLTIPGNFIDFEKKKRTAREHTTLLDKFGNPITLDSALNTATLLQKCSPDDDSSSDSQHHKDIRDKVDTFLNNPLIKYKTPKITAFSKNCSLLLAAQVQMAFPHIGTIDI